MTMVPINVSAIDSYLEAMWALGGTDLHLTAGAPPLVRVDGRLHPLPDQPALRPEETAQLILGVLTDDLSSQFRREKEVDFSFSWHGQTRFRANVYYQQGTMAMALRAIPYRIPTMEELGLPPVMEHFANLPQGLVLVTGPTGSGKSTTQASMIDYINQNRELPHPHDRGPDRVRAHAQALRGQPARGRLRHRLVRPRAALRAARRPRRHPRR